MAVDTSFDKVRVFQCPNCREYITLDAETCRFCRQRVDPQAARAAMAAQLKEEKREAGWGYFHHMIGGLILAFIGVLVIAVSGAAAVSKGDGVIFLPYPIIIAGLADFGYGFALWRKSKRD